MHGFSLEVVQSNLRPGTARPVKSGTELACGRDRPALARALEERLVERPCLTVSPSISSIRIPPLDDMSGQAPPYSVAGLGASSENKRKNLAEDRFGALAISVDVHPYSLAAPGLQARTVRSGDGASYGTDLLPAVMANARRKESAAAERVERARPETAHDVIDHACRSGNPHIEIRGKQIRRSQNLALWLVARPAATDGERERRDDEQDGNSPQLDAAPSGQPVCEQAHAERLALERDHNNRKCVSVERGACA
jgi:hypothetical protein